MISLHVHRLWITLYSSISAVKRTSETLRNKTSKSTFVLLLFNSFTVVIIVKKWIALVCRKINFGQSIWHAGDQRNQWVYDSSMPCIRVIEKIVGPRATAINLKILHPFKYPGLEVISFEYMKISFCNCLPCVLVAMAKVTSLVTKL